MEQPATRRRRSPGASSTADRARRNGFDVVPLDARVLRRRSHHTHVAPLGAAEEHRPPPDLERVLGREHEPHECIVLGLRLGGLSLAVDRVHGDVAPVDSSNDGIFLCVCRATPELWPREPWRSRVEALSVLPRYTARMHDLPQALCAARAETRLTADEFARLLGVSEAEVWRWESGNIFPSSAVIVRCARALAMTVEGLLSRDFAKAPMPALFLRSYSGGDTETLLEDLAEPLAAFVSTAQAIDGLLRERSVSPAKLPEPKANIKYGIGEPPYLADQLAGWARGKLGITTAHVPSMRAVYEALGIPIVWARRGEIDLTIDGASIVVPRPVVLVHLAEGPTCWWRTRMTLAHELCHLLTDFVDESANVALVSPSTADGGGDAGSSERRKRRLQWNLFKGFDFIERRARAFASHFLVPDSALRELVTDVDPTSEDAIERVCKTFGVGRITAVSRLRHVFRFSEDLRLNLLRRAHDEHHEAQHDDVAPDALGLRNGVLLDEVARALADDRIDRLEAHRLLDLPLTAPLPEHPDIDAKQRAPLRSVDESVRGLAAATLRKQGRTRISFTAVTRSAEGWRVEYVDQTDTKPATGVLELSFDLDEARSRLAS